MKIVFSALVLVLVGVGGTLFYEGVFSFPAGMSGVKEIVAKPDAAKEFDSSSPYGQETAAVDMKAVAEDKEMAVTENNPSVGREGQSGGVYKWVDENGKVHFGDKKTTAALKNSSASAVDVTVTNVVDMAQPVTQPSTESTEAENAAHRGSLPDDDKRAKRSPKSSQDPCEAYVESVRCFNSYAEWRGGKRYIRPQGHQRCVDMKKPEGCTADEHP